MDRINDKWTRPACGICHLSLVIRHYQKIADLSCRKTLSILLSSRAIPFILLSCRLFADGVVSIERWFFQPLNTAAGPAHLHGRDAVPGT